MPDLQSFRARLASANQSHLVRALDRLPPDRQRPLLNQLATLDLDHLPELIHRYVTHYQPPKPPTNLEPAPFYPKDPASTDRPWDRAALRKAGARLLSKGAIATFTVAGGQGSRLGFDGPKGCFPAGAVTGKSLFQFFAEAILKAQTKYGATIYWYVMTSPLNHDETTAFFADHHHFGLDPAQLMCFNQGVMPTFDMQGNILLAAPDRIATNPDGHGGSFAALARSGALDHMAGHEVDHISYFHVDNPIPHILDPAFIGLHTAAEDSSAEMSSKMIPKRQPGEKVGIFCRRAGHLEMIEYSDLPKELDTRRRPDDTLLYNCANPGLHVISIDFIRRLTSGTELPYHRAEKKVDHVDPDTGKTIHPTTPNAVKLEKFVFDALPLARNAVILESDRIEEFAPIKNAEGDDSPASSARIQTERAARWLETVGIRIPRNPDDTPNCTIELSPLTAVEPEDLQSAAIPNIKPGARTAF